MRLPRPLCRIGARPVSRPSTRGDGPIGLGIIGLGRAFKLMLSTLAGDSRLRLAAAMDPRPEARERFAATFGGTAHASVESLCADPAVEAVYIASPHQVHCEQVLAAVAAGKHALVEKPMALDLTECAAMIDQAARNGVYLIVGHSHSFDRPVQRTRELIQSGGYGRLRMITAANYTDFLYRPRRPEELETAQGGGVVFSQAAHQVDIVRLLGGGLVRSVRAATGVWDPARPTEGAYNAFVTFEDGASATLTYSGYGHFDTDEWCSWISETGLRRETSGYGESRAALRRAAPGQEIALKAARAYGSESADSAAAGNGRPPDGYNHFGLVVASCERGDLRPTAEGIFVYADDERRFDRLPMPRLPRTEVADELYAAVVLGHAPVHDGAWGMATLEVCRAILQSASEEREILLHYQVLPGDQR